MTLAEFLIGFATIVTGVALTDIVQRIAALIEHRREIRWDWLPLALLANAILILIITWALAWQFIQDGVKQVTLGRFLIGQAAYVLIYLMSVTMLPRDPQPGLDLRGHCERQLRPYWVLFSLILLYFSVHFVWLPWFIGSGPLPVVQACVLTLSTGAALSLTFVRRRLWHVLGGIAFLALNASNLTQKF